MKKDLIIIALIILLIYLYYQQNNQPVIKQDNSETIQQLQTQINHFQTLYEQRVEKDCGDEEKIKNLEEQLALCEEIINKPVSDAETQTELTQENIINFYKLTECYQKSEKQNQEFIAIAKDSQNIAKLLEKELENKEQENEEQLRKINVLFDENAKDYEVIDFNGLYALLQKIAEREREREQNN